MRYLPHTPEDIAGMLTAVGAASLEDFFAVIPAECRRASAGGRCVSGFPLRPG